MSERIYIFYLFIYLYTGKLPFIKIVTSIEKFKFYIVASLVVSIFSL
jgi:hypothetical protein